MLQEKHQYGLGPGAGRLRAWAAGFTLIELLVAVAILGIALLAAFKALGQAGLAIEEGRSRRLAGWVAENRASELRARGAFPVAESRDEGEEEQGGIRFAWREVFKSTPNRDFLRVEISVSDARLRQHELARLVSFLRRVP
jgi:general secretion pathway protein I